MKKKLLIIGGVGSGQLSMSVFQEQNAVTDEWEILGYLTDIKKPGEYLGKYKVYGATADVMKFVEQGFYVHNALYFNAKDKINRVRRFLEFDIPLERNATAIHPTAYIEPETQIGYGVLFAPQSSTSFAPKIGNFVHVYNKAHIAHDAFVEDYVTITGQSYVGARVHVKEGAHIGVNASVKEDLTIGRYAIIGMGAVVVKDVPDFAVVAGNPAKVIKMLQ